MAPDELKLYNAICKDKFVSIEKILDKLKAQFTIGLTGIVGILLVVIADLIVNLPG